MEDDESQQNQRDMSQQKRDVCLNSQVPNRTLTLNFQLNGQEQVQKCQVQLKDLWQLVSEICYCLVGKWSLPIGGFHMTS